MWAYTDKEKIEQIRKEYGPDAYIQYVTWIPDPKMEELLGRARSNIAQAEMNHAINMIKAESNESLPIILIIVIATILIILICMVL